MNSIARVSQCGHAPARWQAHRHASGMPNANNRRRCVQGRLVEPGPHGSSGLAETAFDRASYIVVSIVAVQRRNAMSGTMYVP